MSYYSYFETRIRRARSWLACAEEEYRAGSLATGHWDLAYVLYWIAFNAAFATDDPEQPNTTMEFRKCFGKVRRVDESHIIHRAVRRQFVGTVKPILNNQYLFKKYWDYVNGKPGSDNWRTYFNRENRRAIAAMAEPSEENTGKVLPILFGRLYTLRNQIVHGGATWMSRYNRTSVEHCTPVMAALVPLFIEIIEKHPKVKWGPPYFRPGLRGKTDPE